jgi:hypothetical protein
MGEKPQCLKCTELSQEVVPSPIAHIYLLDENPPSQRGREPSGSNGQLRITYLQNPQIEKVLNGQTVGSGIKKTPAYETPLSKTELEKWRKEFWGKFKDNTLPHSIFILEQS